MALHVLDEANRCLGCKKPMCQQGCPIHTNIPEVIRLLKDNHLDDAGRMLFENNPLTTVCSLVCNHENQCEGHCIRNRMPSHDPVHFSIIEDYISTTYANKMTSGPAPRNGMKAAVVGSGPAGLTVAVLLARWGYDVTIFDARDKIGGVMRYGIPNYRLPDSVLDDFQYRHLELKGIHVRPNTAIGKTITIDDLFRDGYKSVFIGAGLWKANAMHIKGETLGNVPSASTIWPTPRPSSWATTSPSSAWATPPWTAPALPSATAHATSPATPAATRSVSALPSMKCGTPSSRAWASASARLRWRSVRTASSAATP